MQPRESIKAICYLSKSASKNTMRQNQRMDMMIYLSKFKITHLWSLRLRWGSLSCPPRANSKSGLFKLLSHFTKLLLSFLAEAKRTFTKFPTTHHNFGSSRMTHSCLGGFTSKSNKCHKDCFTKLKCSKSHKEDLTQPKLGFLKNNTNLTKMCWEKFTKA
jgi:hypothetical protein